MSTDSLVVLPPPSPLESTLNFYLKAAFYVNMIAVEKLLWRFCAPFTWLSQMLASCLTLLQYRDQLLMLE